MLSLWDFALKSYELPGVKGTLLKLQDRHRMDVNAVFWCLWCARYGYRFKNEEVTEILATTAEMARHATRPLRAVRLFLGSPKVGYDPATLRDLRDRTLALEIMSEELILRRLDEETRRRGEPDRSLGDMGPRSEQLFTMARQGVDMPTMIADEEGPDSPMGLFRHARDIIQDSGL